MGESKPLHDTTMMGVAFDLFAIVCMGVFLDVFQQDVFNEICHRPMFFVGDLLHFVKDFIT